MSTSTKPEATVRPETKAERELVALCQKIDDFERANGSKRIHLFMALKAARVTQTRIAKLARMSDVGVALAISRHLANQAKLAEAAANARDEEERAQLEAERCEFCAQQPAAVDA